jgi:hypothetical protein
MIIVICSVIFLIYRWIEVARERDLQFRYPLQNEEKSSAGKEIQEREMQDKVLLRKVFISGLILIVWQGIWIPTSRYSVEQSESRDQREAYISGYENGWDDQCSAIFSRLGGSGNLAFGRGITITYPQCISLKSSSSGSDSFKENIGGYIRDSSAYEMRDSGRNFANKAVLSKMFSLSPYWCFGSECISEADFGIFRPK